MSQPSLVSRCDIFPYSWVWVCSPVAAVGSQSLNWKGKKAQHTDSVFIWLALHDQTLGGLSNNEVGSRCADHMANVIMDLWGLDIITILWRMVVILILKVIIFSWVDYFCYHSPWIIVIFLPEQYAKKIVCDESQWLFI